MTLVRSLVALAAVSMTLAVTACHDHDHDHDHGVPTGDVSAILALTGDAATGQPIFEGSCGQSQCHGVDGVAGPAPDLTQVVPTRSDEEVARIARYGYGEMPAQDSLSDQQIADVIAYLKDLTAL